MLKEEFDFEAANKRFQKDAFVATAKMVLTTVCVDSLSMCCAPLTQAATATATATPAAGAACDAKEDPECAFSHVK